MLRQRLPRPPDVHEDDELGIVQAARLDRLQQESMLEIGDSKRSGSTRYVRR